MTDLQPRVTRRRPLAALAALLLPVLACGSPDPSVGDGWAGTVDTLPSGRVVVRSSASAAVAGTLEERFRLGSLDEPGPDLFGQIAGLALGPQGEVYVFDGQAAEVRVFASDGAFLRSFGREGAGPGELRNGAGLASDQRGTLWVMNWGNARYTGFDPGTGEVVGEARRVIAFASFPWPGGFEGGARLLDVGLDRGGNQAILRLDTAFVPSDTIALPQPRDEDRIVFRQGGVTVASINEPFAPQPAWAPRPGGGIVVGEGAAYRLHRIAFSGDTTLTMELDREPLRVTAAERDSALAMFQEMAVMLGGAVPDRTPTPRGVKPPHGPIFVDDQDRTWVWSVLADASLPLWDVFDAGGRFLGQVKAPAPPGGLRPVIRGGRMAVATQVNGFPEVVVYELSLGPK